MIVVAFISSQLSAFANAHKNSNVLLQNLYKAQAIIEKAKCSDFDDIKTDKDISVVNIDENTKHILVNIGKIKLNAIISRFK